MMRIGLIGYCSAPALEDSSGGLPDNTGAARSFSAERRSMRMTNTPE
jgi:hypothetical protein